MDDIDDGVRRREGTVVERIYLLSSGIVVCVCIEREEGGV